MAFNNSSPTTTGVGTGRAPPPIITPGAVRDDFIKPNADLSEKERKYCRCLLRVESKGGAYSPYGVCTSRVGAQVHSCSQYYDWGAMDLDMLLAYADLHKIDVSAVTTREQALEAIQKWKQARGENM